MIDHSDILRVLDNDQIKNEGCPGPEFVKRLKEISTKIYEKNLVSNKKNYK